ncbi:MAG TPA: polysaccharide deacetylase family protein [Steroidobacteraceae bacterium]|nr:polysaccharide deacetylase family protein [Steroidobacteraceae bacterium]
MNSKPLASVSLDVDNLWSYLKIHGDDAWQSRPSYLDVFIPHALETLEEIGIKITFFIVGLDAADDRNGAALRSIVAAGHEVGNHSFEHEPWLHLYTPEQVRTELEQAEEAIEAATGRKPVGFRGPGFSWSEEVLEVLVGLGHRFDASTLPTYLGPLARAYYFWTAKMSAEERAKRDGLFGKFSDGLRPVKPYRWQLKSGRSLLEIPVTTMPFFKTPFHFSYLAYLSRFSPALMNAYFGTALAACRLTGTEPSFLLHPLDIIGGDQIPQLKFFPGMDLRSEDKTALFKKVLGKLKSRYDIVPMGEHARAIEARGGLALRAVA